MRLASRLACSLPLLLLALSAQAADPKPAGAAPAAAAAPLSEEEQIDEGLKRFGYLAGLARGCVATAQRAALEREALDVHGGIARLLGVDRAFLFSSSFGYGTTVTLQTKECGAVLKAYESRVEKHRKGQGGAK